MPIMQKNEYICRTLYKTSTQITLNYSNMSNTKYQPDDYYERRVSLFARLNVGHDDIIMLGDSLINGCEWHELLNNPHIKNRGINSDTVEGVRMRVVDVVQGNPKKIFVMVGINDISHNKDAHAIALETAHIACEIHRQSPTTRLYIHSLLPFDASLHYTSLAGKETMVTTVNHLLQKYATECDYTYIDIYTPLLAPDSANIDLTYTNDGLHLNGNGYELWGSLLRPYIDE